MRLGPASLSISINGSSKLFWAAVLLLAGTAAFPLLSGVGLLNTRGGGDSPFLLQRLFELVAALRDGHFPVRWMPNANYGYGYPFYNYYAPLSIYIAAVFRFLGFSYVGAIKAAQAAGFLAAGGGMYVLGRRWFGSHWAGLLAAAAYSFAPFHMVNVYVRGDSLAEFWAMAFYPVVFVTAGNLVREPRRPLHIIFFALSYAALILSHNISALIFTPFLLLYFLLSIGTRFTKPVMSLAESSRYNQSTNQPINPITNYPILLSLLLALALSAWFWLPALAEQGLAQLEPVTAGYFHYSNHFRGADLVQDSLLFDYDVAGGGAFRMGLAQLVVIAAGAAALLWGVIRRRRVKLRLTLLIILSLLIATFMMTPLSRPLWDNLPLLPFTQFPWRFLSAQAFFGALAAAGLALLPYRRLIVPVVVGAIAVSGLGDLRPDHLYLTDADVTAERLAEYEWFTGNIGSTVSAEYLPDYVQPRPFTGPWLEAGTRLTLLQSNPLFDARPLLQETDIQVWQISTAEQTAAVTLPVMEWPGWRVKVAGSVIESYPAPGSGLLTFVVPTGQHRVELHLTRTPVRLAAEIISLAAVLVAVVLLWPTFRSQATRQRLRLAATLLAGLIIFSIGLYLWPVRSLPPDTLSWDFEQSAYLHHSPDGIPFEGDLLLRRYTFSQEEVRPGAELAVTVTWENGNGETADMALMTPAVQRFDAAPILTGQSRPVESGEVVYRLAIPENAPAGLYVPRLTVNGAKALTDSGRRRGDLFLRPVRVLNSSQRARETGSALDARAVDAGYQSPEALLVHLQWLTLQMLTENYNVSLRLVDGNGLTAAQRDAQPGFGYLPSSGWLPGRWENDWLTLPLPGSFSAELFAGPFALVARLYDVETEAVVLTRRLGEMVWENERLVFREAAPVFVLPDAVTPAAAVFEEIIQLQGYMLEQTAVALELTLYWQALVDGREDYFHFVHLVDPATGEIVTQHDSMPRNNSYPTSQWRQGEIVADGLQLSLAGVPPGEYLLYAGLYRNLGSAFPPLEGVDGEGRPLEGDRLLLARVVVE